MHASVHSALEEALTCPHVSRFLHTIDASLAEMSSEDMAMAIEQFTKWAQCGETELRSAGLLGLGNIARSEANCVRVADSAAWDVLLHSVGAADAVEVHAAMSAIRNLSVAKPLRRRLVVARLVPLMLPHMSSFHMPVRYLISNIMKGLTCVPGIRHCGLDASAWTTVINMTFTLRTVGRELPRHMRRRGCPGYARGAGPLGGRRHPL